MVMTKKIKIRNIYIGGGSPVAVQSMTNTDTADRERTLEQIKALVSAGCEIVRFTVNSMDAVRNIPYYMENTSVPLVADIHFDYKLALESVAAGISKIRINPGNIGSDDRVKKVADACRNAGIPVRVGINGGSLEKEVLAKYGSPTAEAIAESAVGAVRRLEKHDFNDIVVSVKSSDVKKVIRANRILCETLDYPLHIGVTEAGGYDNGIIKSAIGIGSLLADGIGDTLRVSLTDDPVKEVGAAMSILKSLGMRPGINLVSCPTCGRTRIDLISIAEKLQKEIDAIHTDRHITAALMGCIVNGPGEAREADVGVAGGDGEGVLFKKGVVVKKIPEDKICEVLLSEIKALACQDA